VCEGYHASLYPCPERASERREMLMGVKTRLDDLATVLGQVMNINYANYRAVILLTLN